MPSFTVHILPGQPDAEPVLVSDGWCWPALVFGPGWLAWHRQWLGLLGYLLLWGGLTLLGKWLGLHTAAASLLSSLLNVALALEGGQIRRWTLRRKGADEVGVIAAANLAEAETRYYHAHAATVHATPVMAAAPMASPAWKAPSWPAHKPGVLGSFPEPGGR